MPEKVLKEQAAKLRQAEKDAQKAAAHHADMLAAHRREGERARADAARVELALSILKNVGA